jgi:NAD(P)-dependent dehydrogenase (short-subunit alcohol dehydrogenase family)
MKNFAGKVAVVTGGASGLGLAMARRFAREGMKIVLADVQQDALDRATGEFRAAGTPVIGVQVDVSKADQVEALKDATLAAFGAAHILCNNAGVAPGGLAWESTAADWEWCMGVNVYGVIHGLRSFVPVMSKSLASWRSCSWLGGSPEVRLTMRPRCTAGRARDGLSAQRCTWV